jgi:hypothetical protein
MNIRNSNNEQIKSKITPNSNNNNSNMKTSSSFFPPPPPSSSTTTKTIFKKLSNSSTSSMTSNSSSTNSLASITNQQPLINPFEETNRFRLEQSVLSPNLFHVANTSTPERDTNSLWNIDQRAVLYPADIPIDESSLMAQYASDYKLSKQVIPAVEAFWTQNKIIIESPLTGTTGSALRAKFGNFFSSSSTSSSSSSSSRTYF